MSVITITTLRETHTASSHRQHVGNVLKSTRTRPSDIIDKNDLVDEGKARVTPNLSADLRERFYLGKWASCSQNATIDLGLARAELCKIHANSVHVNNRTHIEVHKVQLVSRGDLFHCAENSALPVLKKYCSDALTLFQVDEDMPYVLASFGDAPVGCTHLPWFAKTRRVNESNAGAILWPLNIERHYARLAEVKDSDTPWQNKTEIVLWRGADTNFGERARILRRHFARRNIDVALTEVYDPSHQDLKGSPLPLTKMLKHKYLLSLEGNDVASGLKWMLYSNSVVLMSTPTFETWAAESLLSPFVHYIPVDRSLNDIDERIKWARANDGEALMIAENASRFAKFFVPFSTRNHSEADKPIKKHIVATYKSIMREVFVNFSVYSCTA